MKYLTNFMFRNREEELDSVCLFQIVSSPQSFLHPLYIRPSYHLQALRHLKTKAAKAAS